MSNRVYLFSTNFVPGSDTTDRRIAGLSEWSYDIPIGFKLLLSGDPRTCESLAYEGPDSVAIVGDYGKGMANFFAFLKQVQHPSMEFLIDEAREFLNDPANKSDFFLLEPEEYFWLGGDIISLMAELADLGPHMQNTIREIHERIHEEKNPPGFVARLFGARTPARKEDSNDLVYRLGLGGWTNELFLSTKGLT